MVCDLTIKAENLQALSKTGYERRGDSSEAEALKGSDEFYER